ncbi:MAG TPA: efflux RND transporter periplasmic adaptor subunit [Peptococcaceae bacterium]|nr:efflux RND transporter periplasmic adaptor subunit [Peptococcaceae bacterium]
MLGTKVELKLLFLCVLMSCALGLVGCSAETATSDKPKPVHTMLVEEKEQPLRLEYFGITDSWETKKYSFKVAGKIAKIHIIEGQKIEKGQLLAELDKTDLQFALKAAEYTKAKAESAALNAQSFYEKVKVLQENGAASQQELELAQLDWEVKEADYRQAQVDYEYKASMLKDANLFADMNGYVVEILSREGEITAAGYPVVVVRSQEQVVNVGLSEEDVQKVKIGTKAVLLPVGDDKQELKGEVSLIEQIPDPASRTYNAEILIIGNPAANDLYLGSTCRVLLEVGTVRGIWIPLSAIQNDGEDYVYVVREQRAWRQNVKLIDVQDSQVRVEGLKNGDILVKSGMKNLFEGCPVTEGDEKDE